MADEIIKAELNKRYKEHFQKQTSQYVGIFWIPLIGFPVFSSTFCAPFTTELNDVAAAAAVIVAPEILRKRLLDNEFILPYL